MKKITLELKEYSLKTAFLSLFRYLKLLVAFMIIFAFLGFIFSFIDNTNSITSISYFHINIMATFAILIFASIIIYAIKILFVDLIYLNKGKIEHIIYSLGISGIIFTIALYAIYKIDNYLIAKVSTNFYNDLKEIFKELLLPSSFENMHNTYNLEASKILVYKLLFLIILGSITYIAINFLIKKYETIYFNKKRKTLIPPELAKITIHFIQLIIFIILIYGSIVNYINLIEKQNQKINGSNSKIESSSNSSAQDYIPFSIFLAVIGGLLTMATKDLLENYFAGISLQMDAPYEEYDRIKINNSEMLEVRHIGTRADKFYGIESNTEIVIPHKKLINESIVNYTLPTLDYRYEYTLYLPQKYIKESTPQKSRSVPKRGEMVVLLATYINTGVKIPKYQLGSGTFELDIEKPLEQFKALNDKFKNIKFTYQEYLKKIKENENIINNIWSKLKQKKDQLDANEIKHPLKKLFIYELVKTVEATILDPDHKHENDEKEVNLEIKHTVCAILLALKEYQELEKKIEFTVDENNILRKYKSFKRRDYNSIKTYYKMANKLVSINYYYFKLANSLWKLKELQNSLYRKRDIDTASLEILDVPRVTTIHNYSGEGEIGYWEVTANITLELAEQSNEIVHHISMYVDDLWEVFNLPKDYTLKFKN